MKMPFITTPLNNRYYIGIDQIHRYGLFVMQLPENSVLTDEQNNLMLLLTKQISAMLAMEQQNEQQQIAIINGWAFSDCIVNYMIRLLNRYHV